MRSCRLGKHLPSPTLVSWIYHPLPRRVCLFLLVRPSLHRTWFILLVALSSAFCLSRFQLGRFWSCYLTFCLCSLDWALIDFYIFCFPIFSFSCSCGIIRTVALMAPVTLQLLILSVLPVIWSLQNLNVMSLCYSSETCCCYDRVLLS